MAKSRKLSKRGKGGRSKTKSKSRGRARPTKSKSRVTKRSRAVKSRSKSKGKKPKVSPATYNRKKCMATPGWEWVQGKGCRKVKGAKDAAQSEGAAEADTGGKKSKGKKTGARSKSKKSAQRDSGKSPSTFNKTKCQATPGWQWVQGVGCRKVRDYNRPKDTQKEDKGESGESGDGGGDEDDDEEEEQKKSDSAACPKVSPSSYNESLCKATPGWQWIEGVGCRKIRNYKGNPNAGVATGASATPAAPEVASALKDTAKALQSMMPAIQKLTAAT